MKKLILDDNNFIYYKQQKFEGSRNTIVFLHGLMSDMNGSKSLAIEKFAVKNQINFVTFDNLGHGESSSEFLDNNISSWLNTTIQLIQILDLKNVILVGSSMGGWLALLCALEKIDNLSGMVLIAPAPNFTENILQNLTNEQMHELKTKQITKIREDDKHTGIPISTKLIEDGKKHLILERENLLLNIPVIIIHGSEDNAVHPSVSSKLTDIIKCPLLCTKYIKGGDHRLSRAVDIKIILNSIVELMDDS